MVEQNKELIALAKEIYDKITALKKASNTIVGKISDEDAKLKNQLALYGNVYAEILENSGKKDHTVDGQLEDILLKEKSQSMKFVLWGGLATLIILMAVDRMSK